jgi:hypothetical protein
MATAVHASEAAKGRRIIKSNGTGEEHWRTDYIGTRSTGSGGDHPQAFLIEMRAEETILPHYHEVDQFQVFVAGSGALGRHEVPTLAVHYTDHHTGYGPIKAGPHGYSYFTFRARTDPGAKYLHRPGYRESLKPSRKRHGTASALMLTTAPVLRQLQTQHTEPLLGELSGGDGLGAWLHRLGGGMRVDASPAAGSGGQYWLVLNGALSWERAEYGPWSALFVGADEPPLEAHAGDVGLEVLQLQYPQAPSVP